MERERCFKETDGPVRTGPQHKSCRTNAAIDIDTVAEIGDGGRQRSVVYCLYNAWETAVNKRVMSQKKWEAEVRHRTAEEVEKEIAVVESDRRLSSLAGR